MGALAWLMNLGFAAGVTPIVDSGETEICARMFVGPMLECVMDVGPMIVAKKDVGPMLEAELTDGCC